MTAAAPAERWSTKEQAAEFLGLSVRRIEELAKLHGWTTERRKLPDRRAPVTTIRFSDLEAFKVAQNAPTIDVGQSVAVVKREQREAREIAPIAMIERLVERLAPKPAEVALPKYKWITLGEAAHHVGLERRTILEACESGRLASLWKGSGKNRHRVVKVEAVEQLEAGGVEY